MHGPPPPPFPVPFSPAPEPVPPPPPGSPGRADAAPRIRRLAAWSLDAALLAGVAGLLAVMTWGRLHGSLVDGLPGKVLSAAGGLLLSGGDAGQAAEAFGMGLWRTIVRDIEQALALLVLIELLYHLVLPACTGRTLGKTAMDIRVRAARATAAGRGPGLGRAARRALVGTAAGTGLYAGAWVLLLEGMFFFALVAWLLAVAVFVANSAPTLFGARRRSLADAAAGTVVVRARSYQRVKEATRYGAVAAWDGAQAAGQVAGQVAGQAARDNAARLAQSGRAQQALESAPVRQVQDMGKRLGGRVRNAYRDRRDDRLPGSSGQPGELQHDPYPQLAAPPQPNPVQPAPAHPGLGEPVLGRPAPVEPVPDPAPYPHPYGNPDEPSGGRPA
ncbi:MULTISPECIES: RDD family protein [Thermomonosporaceae]|uniref:RDD family protein n=1 Tax=Thermomonosporaceae TaxID=2012 RepID=UPI00255AA0AD|nr:MULTISPECIES: RDD family protein [Thermomonosporaceae]MDL4777841.1 RDD family protein [Actinomadura xylanilytica]